MYVDLPPGARSRDLVCTFTARGVEMGVRGQPPLLAGALGGRVCPADCAWSMEPGLMTIVFEKDVKTWWAAVVQVRARARRRPASRGSARGGDGGMHSRIDGAQGHDEIDATRVDSTKAVSEYDEETQAEIRKIMVRGGAGSEGWPRELASQQTAFIARLRARSTTRRRKPKGCRRLRKRR